MKPSWRSVAVLAALSGLLALSGGAAAQQAVGIYVRTCNTNSGVSVCGWLPIDSTNPLPVSGSFSFSWPGTAGLAAYGGSPTGTVPAVNAAVTQSALPTGAATAPNQAIEISSLSTIATNSAEGVKTAGGAAAAQSIQVEGLDPCAFSNKSFADFSSSTSGGSIITSGGGSKQNYICGATIVTSAAAQVSLVGGTGSSVCTGGTVEGVFLNAAASSAAASGGAYFAANGGVNVGGANATVAKSTTAAQNLCVVFTTTNTPTVNVHVSYVQQ